VEANRSAVVSGTLSRRTQLRTALAVARQAPASLPSARAQRPSRTVTVSPLSANDARASPTGLDEAGREPGVLAELAQRNDRRQFGTRHDQRRCGRRR
jgi:hypothetical protein